MWLARSLQLLPVIADFSSSGQGRCEDVALVADGEQIANLLGLVDWDFEPVQLSVCDHCGFSRCSPGGYASPRRVDDTLLFVPSLHGHSSSTENFDATEYAAPSWLLRKGVLAVPAAEWERLRNAGAPLPDSEAFPRMTWAEAFLAAQLEAPFHLLGELGQRPAVPLRRRVVATDPWMDMEVLERLGDAGYWGGLAPGPRLLRTGFERLSLVLDDPLASVDLFARLSNGSYGLYFAPGWALTSGEVA